MRLTTSQTQPGVHCETTMLRNMLRHIGTDISEPMLFGLGQGIDFQYWDVPESAGLPMLTGRTGPAEVARNACEALGVELCESQAKDSDAAHEQTVALLDTGHVVGITVDIYHLDYFSSRSHFSAHFLALYDLDDEFAHVVDTAQQGGAQRLPIASLRRARASNEGFMPSPNSQLHVGEKSERHQGDLKPLLRAEVWPAIRSTAARMVSERGPNLGINAMRKAASEMPRWNTSASGDPVPGVGRFWRFAGTGGTNFRGLFLEFLREADELLDHSVLAPAIVDFDGIQRRWDDLIELLLAFGGSSTPDEHLKTAAARMEALAEAEERAFRDLLALAARQAGGAA
ncbi:BtrH N-terminal domain-containing protein [Streptomyces yokosukanensis]|uniref:BtrH N-terminal domain-containing protein n=1 Tax=Streptomyces yokosukanensis TaxID=67386 RepID=UPI003433AB8E